MTYSLHFLPEAEEDVVAGYGWYEKKAMGLGEEFLRMFYACVGEIPRNPLIYPEAHGKFRRCLLRRFPYAIYFMMDGNKIIVFGFFHCARDPRAIGTKLRDRDEPKNP